MAGHGPAPKPQDQRRTAHKPQRGEWQANPNTGWQHGDMPRPPTGLLKVSRDAWTVWMSSWFAAHWTPDDLPALRSIVALFDQVQRGEYVRMPELRLWFDTYGISPKGQQDRRWAPPKAQDATPAEPNDPAGPYGHLRVVNE